MTHWLTLALCFLSSLAWAQSITTKSGNTNVLVTTSGPLISGDCTKWDANGNAIDAGLPCGSSGGSSLGWNVLSINASTGAFCDGGSHPLSIRYGTLAAAQAHYGSWLTSLTQEIDYAELQSLFYTSFGAPTAEHGASTWLNVPVYIPPARCYIGNTALSIRNADGIYIKGAGQFTTIITSGNGPNLQFDGLWYSRIEGIAFESNGTFSGTGIFEIDGNVPGHPYSTRGVQGNVLQDIFIGNTTGPNSDYAFTMCRQGGGGAQCSENQYYNLHLYACNIACYNQTGFNAVDNNWFGGDCQWFNKDCINLAAGSMGVYKVSFESTTCYTQIANGGYDIDASFGGVGDIITVIGSRTESMRFYKGNGSQNAHLIGITQNGGGSNGCFISNQWQANVPYALGTITEQQVGGVWYSYHATTGGTSGGIQPVWPTSGTIADGTVVWTQYVNDFIAGAFGDLDLNVSNVEPMSHLDIPTFTDPFIGAFRNVVAAPVTATTYQTTEQDKVLLVDPTSNPITITIQSDLGQAQHHGRTYTIQRITNGTNAVTVNLCCVGGGNGTSSIILPGGTYDGVSIDGTNSHWYVLGYFHSGAVVPSAPALFAGPVGTLITVVGSLPACTAALQSTHAFVTDATLATFHSTAAGGGGNKMAVVCDGTNWYLD